MCACLCTYGASLAGDTKTLTSGRRALTSLPPLPWSHFRLPIFKHALEGSEEKGSLRSLWYLASVTHGLAKGPLLSKHVPDNTLSHPFSLTAKEENQNPWGKGKGISRRRRKWLLWNDNDLDWRFFPIPMLICYYVCITGFLIGLEILTRNLYHKAHKKKLLYESGTEFFLFRQDSVVYCVLSRPFFYDFFLE